jgi:outer membrane murein-binding lipoprotein Lpp
MPAKICLGCVVACGLLLAGCVAPQKLQKVQADAAQYDTALQARKSNAQCSQMAMPGTPEHLACRLAKTSNAN